MNLIVGEFYQDPNLGRLKYRGPDNEGVHLFTSYTRVFGRWEDAELALHPVLHKFRLANLKPAKSIE